MLHKSDWEGPAGSCEVRKKDQALLDALGVELTGSMGFTVGTIMIDEGYDSKAETLFFEHFGGQEDEVLKHQRPPSNAWQERHTHRTCGAPQCGGVLPTMMMREKSPAGKPVPRHDPSLLRRIRRLSGGHMEKEPGAA